MWGKLPSARIQLHSKEARRQLREKDQRFGVGARKQRRRRRKEPAFFVGEGEGERKRLTRVCLCNHDM